MQLINKVEAMQIPKKMRAFIFGCVTVGMPVIAFAAQPFDRILASSGSYKYFFFQPWVEGSESGYVFGSNDVVKTASACIYHGDGWFVVRSKDGFDIKAKTKDVVVVFPVLEGNCPTLTTDFTSIDATIDRDVLDLIKHALDIFWSAACQQDRHALCSYGMPLPVSIKKNGTGKSVQYVVSYKTGATLVVHNENGNLVVGEYLSLNEYEHRNKPKR